MSDDASRPDNRACPDGNAAADGGICTDPDVFLQRNGCRGANAVAALLRVDGMTGAGKAYAGGNKGTFSDVYRRSIQNDAVIVDDRQAVGMDVEAIWLKLSTSLLSFILKINLPVSRMWLANLHSILRGGLSLSMAKAAFILPA